MAATQRTGAVSPPRRRDSPPSSSSSSSSRRSSSPPPPCPVKSLAQFGQLAKDVLYGNRTEGLYGSPGASKFVISSTTGGGVTLTTTATSSSISGSIPLSGQVVATYSSPSPGGSWLGDLLLTSGGVAEATLSRTIHLPAPAAPPEGGEGQPRPVKPLPPGKVVVGCVVSLPALAEKAQMMPPKITLDYSGNYLVAKSSATVAPKPLLTANAVAGMGKVALGGEAAFSSATRRLTRWSAAAGWIDDRQHIGLTLTPATTGGGGGGGGSGKATLLYGYSLRPGLALALEATADPKPAWEAMFTPPPPPPPPPSGAAAEAGSAAGGTALTPAAAAVSKGGGFSAVQPTFALGASYRLPGKADGGGGGSGGSGSGGGSGVVKFKVSSRGMVSLMYRDTLSVGPRVTLTAELDGLDPSRGPKLGMQLEV
ncbi:hypothetical protein PLESTB_001789400 [Pleodorina starrii]|uniref:Uncharacterized protein n=1 Tax=Pleodorina starrii TaxID=330485 RepID=A0A9W6C1C3_9CHLO|nr:hypothetical protein PLESTM_001759900 [Pleodorina starrii]GLC61670.1 hypothetical protein PLESTB_001789400 [Pleodorina starrii]GLC76509.1 hypothetical protein PLESTF_001790600 [Pleodorina starrii]